MSNIGNSLRKHLGPDSYNDSVSRAALKEFLYTDKPFQKYVINQFEITAPIDLIFDPLDKYDVDAGIYQAGNLIGLIEVDYYKAWNPIWPYNYKWAHGLPRKLKYWQGRNLPYIACTFNTPHDKILVITDEMLEKYKHNKTWKKCYIGGEYVLDEFIEIPLPVTKKFGSWTTGELKRVS